MKVAKTVMVMKKEILEKVLCRSNEYLKKLDMEDVLVDYAALAFTLARAGHINGVPLEMLEHLLSMGYEISAESENNSDPSQAN